MANKLIELGCETTYPYFLLARCYEEQKSYKKAIKQLEKLTDTGCRDLKVYFLLARCYKKIGKIKKISVEEKKLIFNVLARARG